MKRIKIISGILCLLIVLSALSACGSSPKKDIVGTWVQAGYSNATFKFQKGGSFWSSEGSGQYVIGNKTLTISVESEKEIIEWNEDFIENPDSDCWYVDGDFLVMWGRYYIRAGADQNKVLKKYIGKDLSQLSQDN